jgi:hypothetical protein
MGLDASWIRQWLGDAKHIILTGVIKLNSIRPAVFDFQISNVFVPRLVSEMN